MGRGLHLIYLWGSIVLIILPCGLAFLSLSPTGFKMRRGPRDASFFDVAGAIVSCLEEVNKVIRVDRARVLVQGVSLHCSQASGLKVASVSPMRTPS